MPIVRTALYVAQDRRLEGGGILFGERLSRPLQRVTVLKRVLKRVRRRNHAAYAMQVTVL